MYSLYLYISSFISELSVPLEIPSATFKDYQRDMLIEHYSLEYMAVRTGCSHFVGRYAGNCQLRIQNKLNSS